MMSKLAALQAQINTAIETAVDMNEVETASSGARLLPKGFAFARLVEYIEYGNQKQSFAGKPKDPAPEFSVGFALWGTAPNGETFHNDDGSPYVIRPYRMALKRFDKAQSRKLFEKMNYTGLYKHFMQFLGHAFLVFIDHEEKSKTDKTIVSRVDFDRIMAPNDPVSGAPYNIPEAPDELYRVFLWDQPTKEAWDALAIEGTDDKGQSKNYIQNHIMQATNFSGSALEQMLSGGAGLPLPGAGSSVQGAVPAGALLVPPTASAVPPPASPQPAAAPPTVPVVHTPVPGVVVPPAVSGAAIPAVQLPSIPSV